MLFNLECLGEEMKVKFTKVKCGVRGSNLGISFFASFFGMSFFKIIKIASNLPIQILGHISFFKLTSEYLEYILKKEVPRYKLNRNPTEFSKDRS
jgi:hypothetical protein